MRPGRRHRRADAWDVIQQTPHLTWQILTKRPERIVHCLPSDWGLGWDHVQLGVSIEDEKRLYRSAILSGIPCKKRFISFEPLLELIDLGQNFHLGVIQQNFHWASNGGESGNEEVPYKYRPCEFSWFENIINDLVL